MLSVKKLAAKVFNKETQHEGFQRKTYYKGCQ